LPVRPTTDIAKVALFNILNNHFDFEGLTVLDLFAGTGNISYEFVSRGASKVTAVDNNFRCTGFIGETARNLQVPDVLTVVKSDAFHFLSWCHAGYDIVFADPPYDLARAVEIPNLVFQRKLLVAGGWLVVEHPAAFKFQGYPFFIDHRNYGKVHFSIFEQPKTE